MAADNVNLHAVNAGLLFGALVLIVTATPTTVSGPAALE
jgi:hypothetical protein